MGRHTIRVDDPDLEEYLKSADSKSEAVREALRTKLADERDAEVDVGLTDVQRQGLDVLLAESFQTDGSAAGKISKDVAESRLAQRLQIAGESVVRVVIRPLIRAGYVRLTDRKTALNVYREPQSELGSTVQEAPLWPRDTDEETEGCNPHLRDSTGVCLRCGDDPTDETDTDADRTEAVADGSGGTVVLSGELTQCDGDDCGRMLTGTTTTCFDCRGESDD